MAAILFFELGQNYYQTSFCANLMKLAGIFQDLEHLYDFQAISYGSHFVFQNEAKIFQRLVFIAINIPCKFGEDIFINDMQKRDERTRVRKAFYNLPTMAFGRRWEIINVHLIHVLSCNL